MTDYFFLWMAIVTPISFFTAMDEDTWRERGTTFFWCVIHLTGALVLIALLLGMAQQ